MASDNSIIPTAHHLAYCPTSHAANPRGTAILVLGMHRSGTSALARVTNLLGAELPANLMPASDQDNERGFWESLDTFQLNEEILRSAGSRWDDWGLFNPDWCRSIKSAAFKRNAVEVIKREFPSRSLFVLKDPRICRILPFWLQALEEASVETKCIIIIRNPLEVAYSLKRRNELSLSKSFILWLRHVLDAEAGTRGLPRSIVTYEQLLSDWRGLIAKTSRELDIAWPRRSASAEFEIDQFLSEPLRHHRASDADLIRRPDTEVWVRQAYFALRELAEGVEDASSAFGSLDQIRLEFDRASRPLRILLHETEIGIDQALEKLERSEKASAAQQGRLADLEHVLVQSKAEASELLLAAEAKGTELAALRASLNAQQGRIEEDAQRIAEISRVVQEKDQVITEQQQNIKDLRSTSNLQQARIEEHAQTIADISGVIQERNRLITEQQLDLEQLRGEIRQLETSISNYSEACAREQRRADRMQQERNQLLYGLSARQSGNAWLIAQKLERMERRWRPAARLTLAVPKILWWTARLKLAERLRIRRDVQIITRSGLFDEQWYIDINPDAVIAGYRPIVHWILHGYAEGRDPNPLFDTDWYVEQYPESISSGMNPLVHYIVTGADAGYDPSPLFNTAAYLAVNPGVKSSGWNPLAHRLAFDQPRGGSPLPDTLMEEPSVDPFPASLQGFANTITFPATLEPEVSIIVPVHNQVSLTLSCLKSITDCGASFTFEVIVIDDFSNDETADLLPHIHGLRLIHNDVNLGFTLSCNRGAALAKGKHIVFLNNDTTVSVGWLDALVDTIRSQPDAGIVGAKLVYPSGRLQEAGGIVWSDGSASNVGRGDDPDRPEYCYLRAVDYCSGACILISTDLFKRLGGFDERYAPAYYEDTDLAFKVREHGLRVFFQPESRVTHHEGGTAGLDVSQGAKRYQLLNQEKFYERWRSVLAEHGAPTSDVFLAKDRWIRARALVVDVWPTPDRDSGSIDTVNLLKLLLSFNYKVTFFPANTLEHFGAYTANLQRIGVECVYAPYVRDIEQLLEVVGRHLDVIFLRRVSFGGRYLELARKLCPTAKIIFDTVDLHYLREGRQAELEQSWELQLAAAATKELELEYAKKSDGTIVVSEFERDTLRAELPDVKVWWMPFSRDAPGSSTPFEERRDILFVGAFEHQPNVDAVTFFLQSVWPLAASRLMGVRFLIAGSNMPSSFQRWASKTVVLLGHVRCLDTYLNKCRLTVAPLRFGAGTKGKVVSSMSFGVPVVATPLAIEGMRCTPGLDVAVGQTPEELANAMIEVYSDELVWNRLSDNGLSLARSLYSHNAAAARMVEFFEYYGLPSPQQTAALLPDIAETSGASGAVPGSLRLCEPDPLPRESDVRVIAFYLPQFHPIPENDLWWGKGFTEWTNVSRARPLFPGHYQPHHPGELGFYDLRVAETREAQAALAREFGIYGFCYYHYWFSGRRLLERPFREVLSSGRPDFPFCLCWANENWTRRWDGRDDQVLMQQVHTPDNDRRFIQELFPAFSDERYIRINGKPLLLVYRTELLPEPRRTADIWREECVRSGVGEPYLCRAESFHVSAPDESGFDAAYEFPPLSVDVREMSGGVGSFGGAAGSADRTRFSGKVFPYDELVRHMSSRECAEYARFSGVMVSWDNTPRRSQDGYIWLGSSPALFQRWVSTVTRQTRERFVGDERVVFVNAWNEWAEGCHLEPDQRYGRMYLESIKRAITSM